MNYAKVIWTMSRVRLMEILQTEDLNRGEMDIVISCHNGRDKEMPDEIFLNTGSRQPRRGETARMKPHSVNPPASRFYCRKPLGGGFVHSKTWTNIEYGDRETLVDLRTWTIFSKAASWYRTGNLSYLDKRNH